MRKTFRATQNVAYRPLLPHSAQHVTGRRRQAKGPDGHRSDCQGRCQVRVRRGLSKGRQRGNLFGLTPRPVIKARSPVGAFANRIDEHTPLDPFDCGVAFS